MGDRIYGETEFMAQLLIRNLDDDVKARLRDRARKHGRSTEDEVREILRNALRDEAQASEPLGKRLRAIFRGHPRMARPARAAGRTPVIILDANVLSAMMRAADDTTVEHWFDAQPTESVWTTTVTVFEIRFGLGLLAAGRRRDRLDRAFLRAIDEALGGRVLSFDRGAAEVAAVLAARQRQIGRTVEIRDVQIAGIAAARKATLATRNTRHFEHLGLKRNRHDWRGLDPAAGIIKF